MTQSLSQGQYTAAMLKRSCYGGDISPDWLHVDRRQPERVYGTVKDLYARLCGEEAEMETGAMEADELLANLRICQEDHQRAEDQVGRMMSACLSRHSLSCHSACWHHASLHAVTTMPQA